MKRRERADRPSPERWYQRAGGLAFECTACGRCCTGKSGYVWVGRREIDELAGRLGLTLDELGRRYLRRVGRAYALLERPVTGDCVFLDGTRCTVYDVRPSQCRAFPFWRRNVATPDAWEETARACEGIRDDAPIVPARAIEAALEAARKA